MIKDFQKLINNRAGKNSISISVSTKFSALLDSLDNNAEEIIHSTINEYENAAYIQGFSDAMKLLAWLP